MNFKMPKSQEQPEQLQNKELEAGAGGRLNDLLKNLSLPGKVAGWAAVAASVVGISVSMAMAMPMPAEAINGVRCHEDGYLGFVTGRSKPWRNWCFANAGTAEVVIADVHSISPGNNAGYVDTNKGRFHFGKYETIDFMGRGGVGTVTIRIITIY